MKVWSATHRYPNSSAYQEFAAPEYYLVATDPDDVPRTARALFRLEQIDERESPEKICDDIVAALNRASVR